LTTNDQHAPTDTASAISDAATLVSQDGTRTSHRGRQHADTVLQQRAVRRIVHMCLYDRGVDAKSTAVRDRGTLRHLDDLTMQLLNDRRAQRARDLQNRSRRA